MRLYILTYANIYGFNGAAGFIRKFCENIDILNRNGIDLIVLSNSESYTDEREYRKSKKFKVRDIIKGVLNRTSIGKVIHFQYYLNHIGTAVVGQMREEFPDDSVVMLNDFFVAYNFYKKYGQKYKTIFMMHNNGKMFSMLPAREVKFIMSKLQEIERTIIQSASYIVFVSNNSKDTFTKHYPNFADKCIVINIGIDSADAPIGRKFDKLNLVCVGTICGRKNQIAILRAIKKINNPEITLTLVGGGESTKLKKYAKNNGLDKQIIFAGPQQDVTQYLNRANAYISASNDEGLPISAQEAMRAKLPLIMTDVGGCTELIDGNGILINPKDDAIESAIRYSYENLGLLEKWGDKSYEIFDKRYRIETMLDKYVEMVKGL